jgi:hypothetical protein
MTKHSICFAGLSREEEAEVVSRFKQANARTANKWLVTPETEAAVLVIDMDSMYGQMSLMKAIGTGKILVALTASGRAETDYVLQRPVTADALVALFEQIDGAAPAPAAKAPESAAVPAPAAPAPPPAAPAPAAPAPVAAAPTPAAAPAPSPRVTSEQPAFMPPARTAEPRLADYLRPGALAGPVRLQLTGAPDLVLDPATQTYLSGAALKPLAPYCTAIIRESDLVAVDPAQLPALSAQLGGSQPWARLAWLCALTGGNGALAPGYGPNDRYKLLKWPQTEREFPKHFRIATVMMKGPANLTEIAEQSGVSLAEVIDFVNASLVSGVAESDVPAPASAGPDKGGLLGRFRR